MLVLRCRRGPGSNDPSRQPSRGRTVRALRTMGRQTGLEIEDRDKTGPLVMARDRFRAVRRKVIHRGWHHNRILGPAVAVDRQTTPVTNHGIYAGWQLDQFTEPSSYEPRDPDHAACEERSAVKPSAQPTLVRTQHPPPRSKPPKTGGFVHCRARPVQAVRPETVLRSATRAGAGHPSTGRETCRIRREAGRTDGHVVTQDCLGRGLRSLRAIGQMPMIAVTTRPGLANEQGRFDGHPPRSPLVHGIIDGVCLADFAGDGAPGRRHHNAERPYLPRRPHPLRLANRCGPGSPFGGSPGSPPVAA